MSFNHRYNGPADLAGDISTALLALNEQLTITIEDSSTHKVLLINGFSHAENLEATAVYLVGAIAAVIEQNLRIRRALYFEETLNQELLDNVISIIGDENINDENKTMVRNPWLWEGISHMFIHLSRLNSNFHPSGSILVKTSIKHDVHDHGLDMIGIYRDVELGLSLGECKAYLKDPSGAISDASTKLSEVDAKLRDNEIRSTINQLQHALTPADQDQIAGAFWRNERSYMPFICCDDESSVNWHLNRKPLNRLQVPVTKKLLVPLSIPDALEVFDAISLLMKEYSTHTKPV